MPRKETSPLAISCPRAWLLSAAFALSGPGLAHAEGWARQCVAAEAGRTLCYVEQNAASQPGGPALLNVMFAYAGQGGQARMIVTAPLGVLLAPGLAMTVDAAKPVALPYESCRSGGCRAVVDLDKVSLAQIRAGKTMTLRFVVADSKAVEAPVSLQGLDAALQSLAQ